METQRLIRIYPGEESERMNLKAVLQSEMQAGYKYTHN